MGFALSPRASAASQIPPLGPLKYLCHILFPQVNGPWSSASSRDRAVPGRVMMG